MGFYSLAATFGYLLQEQKKISCFSAPYKQRNQTLKVCVVDFRNGYATNWWKNGGVALYHSLQPIRVAIPAETLPCAPRKPPQVLQINAHFWGGGTSSFLSWACEYSFDGICSIMVGSLVYWQIPSFVAEWDAIFFRSVYNVFHVNESFQYFYTGFYTYPAFSNGFLNHIF